MSYTSDDEKELLTGFVEWMSKQTEPMYLPDQKDKIVAKYLKERDDSRAWGSGGGECE